MNFETMALRIHKELEATGGYEVPNTAWSVEFGRRLRAEWMAQQEPVAWRRVLKKAREGISAGSRSISDMDTEQAIAVPLLDHIEQELEKACLDTEMLGVLIAKECDRYCNIGGVEIGYVVADAVLSRIHAAPVAAQQEPVARVIDFEFADFGDMRTRFVLSLVDSLPVDMELYAAPVAKPAEDCVSVPREPNPDAHGGWQLDFDWLKNVKAILRSIEGWEDCSIDLEEIEAVALAMLAASEPNGALIAAEIDKLLAARGKS